MGNLRDWADRLTGAGPPVAGGTPVLSDLCTTGTAPSIVYNSHGNTIRLWDQRMI